MEYYVLMAYKPITLNHVHKLAHIGVITPYYTGDETINTYAYVPVEHYPDIKDEIHHIIGNDFTLYKNYKVSKDQIQKQITKTEELNKVSIGDTVFCKGYYKLPFTINSLLDGKAIISHHLKNRPISIEVDTHLLRAATSSEIPYQQYTKKTIPTNNKSIIIDCDIITTKYRSQYYQELLRLMINTKLYYIDYNLILLNTITTPNDILYYLGVKTMTGSIYSINEYPIISNNPLSNPTNTYYKGLILPKPDDTEELYYLNRIRKKSELQTKELINRLHNHEPEAILELNQLMKLKEQITKFNQPLLTTREYTEPSPIAVEKQLIRIGFKDMQARADDLIYLIRGQG